MTAFATTNSANWATATLVGFARTVRSSGVAVDQRRIQAFLEAVAALDLTVGPAVYWAGRLTLCGTQADLARYDACFAYYFSDTAPVRPDHGAEVTLTRPAVWPDAVAADAAGPPRDPDEQGGAASGVEVLRTADIARLDAPERAEVARLLGLVRVRRRRRPTRRRSIARRGQLDPARTLRAVARGGGEPIRLLWRNQGHRPRRVVLLVDVSGSMSPYAEALLRLGHALMRGHPRHTEVFSLGTRLTRITHQLAIREGSRALAAAGTAIPDWRGGTRLGAELKEFLDLYGQRGMARGAVVVIASDGWERGGAELLGAQMARLSRLAHEVVWANPHRAQPGYVPATAGMRAALPHVDRFVSGHSLAALEELAQVVIGGTPVAPVPAGPRMVEE
ncbi:VWA domain-containing protein [Lipingzhangella sp. LS1_29]|uniref:VWA domain-containing protein n=1 Tax=Lipingzhangella rawalii TaxID=2055835 RepID=A0ABU2H3L7_9ACTN|nr:VWA domain-containing protein [Lipingzhangella rawalii]MDS1269445.1 VWA domain-containing protein [Lipingzhangella rawalii]